jgi:hypothetical protein
MTYMKSGGLFPIFMQSNPDVQGRFVIAVDRQYKDFTGRVWLLVFENSLQRKPGPLKRVKSAYDDTGGSC